MPSTISCFSKFVNKDTLTLTADRSSVNTDKELHMSHANLVFLRCVYSTDPQENQKDADRSVTALGLSLLDRVVPMVMKKNINAVICSSAQRARTCSERFAREGIPVIEVPELYSLGADMEKLQKAIKEHGDATLIKYIRLGYSEEFKLFCEHSRKMIRAALDKAKILTMSDWDAGIRTNLCFIEHAPLLMASLYFNPLNGGLRGAELQGFCYGYQIMPGEAIWIKRNKNVVLDWDLLTWH